MKKSKLQAKANKYIVEYLKCKNDFNYFCSAYVLLEVPGGDQLFNLYDKQKELIDIIEKDHFGIVLKSRQVGISTTTCGYAAWLTNFYDNTVVGIISKDGKEATDFARNIRGMIEKLPDWLKPKGGGINGRGFAKKTEQSFILTNGSKCYASPVNPQAPEKTLRGKAVTFLIIDEAAFIGKLDIAWTAMVPTLSTAQMLARKAGIPYGTLILSTPNKTTGVGKWYYNKYLNSLSGDDIFKPFIIHWKMIPELADDPLWYQTQCTMFENDPRKIQQELELKFLPSEGSFFDSETVEKMQNSTIIPQEKVKLFNGEIWKFADPVPGAYYLIGVDTATEYGNDKSAVTVWNYETLEQVWEYAGKLPVLDFVKIVKFACSMYRNGICIIESNSCGNQVVEQIKDSPEHDLMVYKEKTGQGNTFKPGLTTSAKTRPLMIDAMYSYVSQFPEMVKSERLALELTGLVTKNSGRVEADIDAHDDLAMSMACAMYVRKYDSSRLMIETDAETSEAGNVISQIVSMNNPNSSLSEFSSAAVIKRVKNNMEDFGGIVNVLDMFDSA